MDKITRAWYGLHLENSLLKKTKQEYEDFFCEGMELLHLEDFQRVKAAGRDGDGKADGYLISEKCVFQSYAPSSGFKKDLLLNKIKEDFEGAKAKWGEEMKKWVFIHNDPEGLPKYAIDLILELKKENPEIKLKMWSPSLILKKFLFISISDLASLFGLAPTQKDIVNLTHEPIKTLLKAMKAQVNISNKTIYPVSVNKLQFNKLSDNIEILLTAGRLKENLVEDLLQKWPDPEYGEDLAEAFRDKYSVLKSNEVNPDDIFMELQSFAGGDITSISAQVSSMAVLSYFFERCDIFENAPTGWTT